MAEPSADERPDAEPQAPELEGPIGSITEVLIAVASGRFDVRATRSFAGDPMDVLAFMVNATAEEVGILVETLEAEREELKRARDALVLAEKLAALGELSAGVAHELNQPLTVIRMIAELLSKKPDARVADCAKDLAMISESARRMGRIVDSVQAFARSSTLTMSRIEPTQPLEDALVLLDESLRQSSIAIDRTYASGLPSIVADADRLQQVFVNLLVNAKHAIEAHGSPSATIHLALEADEAFVRYRIADEGTGVAPEHIARIFDPFFTTKPVGSGTGLGLAVSHGIASEHGGSLRYEPRVPHGACFVLEIPRPMAVSS